MGATTLGKRRAPQRAVPTADSLSNVALHYLARFAASEAGLRRVLENRVRRAAMAHEAFAADKAAQATLRAAIETIIARHKKSGVLDDAAFAAMKARSLRRAGGSARRIAEKLQHKGIAKPLIAAALQPEEGLGVAEAERQAALAYAKRRRLGPYRKQAADEAQRRKDYAAMARAGFAYAVAATVLGGEAEEEAAL